MDRVLLVEDDRAFAEAVVSALEERGHEVTVARTIDEAFRAYLLREEGELEFDVVLCDYELPVVEGGLNNGRGTDFLLEVHKDDPRPRTVLWSGLDRTQEAYDAGVEPDVVATKDRVDVVLAVLG